MSAEAAGRSPYRRLAGNTTAAFGGRLAAIVLALVLSTALFRGLGPAAYGVWAFCYMFVGYQALFDLGLGSTVERLVAQAFWASDRRQLARVLNQAATCSIVFAAVLQAIALAVPVSEVGGIDVRGLRFALPLSVLLSLLASITGAGLSGVQRLGRLAATRTAMNFVSTGSVLLVMAAGVRRIEWLLLAYSLGLAGASILAWLGLEREVGRLRFAPALVDRQLLREFARFGGAVQVGSFGPQLADQAFRLVIGFRFGAPWMGYYDLGSRAAVVLRSVAGTLLVPMVPFGVQQHLAGGTPALTRLFQLTLKYTALWLLPASGLALYHSEPLISLWLGASPGAAHVLLVFQVFVVANALAGLGAPIAMIGRAAGVPGTEAVLVLVTSGAGLLGGAVVPGVLGSLLAFGGMTVVGAHVLWWRLSGRVVGVSTALSDLGGAFGIAVVAVGLSHVLARLDAEGHTAAWVLLVRLVLLTGIPMVVSLVLAWVCGLVTPTERKFWRTVGVRADREGSMSHADRNRAATSQLDPPEQR